MRKSRPQNMLSEGNSFMKGMMLGGLFCLLLSFLGSLTPEPQSGSEVHHHHHIKAPSKAELQRLPDTLKLQLSQRVQVYCVIMVQPKILTYWATAKSTWSKHCDKAEFYTSEAAKVLEAVNLNEKDEWSRVRRALTHALQNAGDTRWFFLAPATTFAIIENLKYLLIDKDPSQPFYIGRAVKSGELEYVEYASGLVLSYEALRQLVEIFQDRQKCPEGGNSLWKLSLDKELALCLKYTGVIAENGRTRKARGSSTVRVSVVLFLTAAPKTLQTWWRAAAQIWPSLSGACRRTRCRS
ncbi:hypothetical protein AGOR_G00017220 [Albula goreensis]|uniref:C1GALT1-specific chaperone 1 n=1 Tax=Albula goreensis TaxID=1534307 RepID=A0A8T3E6W4_9TELE|nr:hypothetical protein AGOR_G00017220 [Albula goreensis]